MSVLDLRWMVPVSFNGNNINDWVDSTQSGNYRAMFPQGFGPENPVKPIYTERNDNLPIYSGQHINGRSLPIKIEVRSGSSSAFSTLMGWLDSLDVGGTYKLIVKNSNVAPYKGDGSQWYVYAKVIDAPRFEPPYTITFTLAIADTIWKNNTPSSDSWSITASGQTQNLTVGGNKFFRPKFTMTPTTAKTGDYAYKKYILVYNQTTNPGPLYYLDVSGQTGKAFNTSALINNTAVSNQINQIGGIGAADLSITIGTPVGGGLPTSGGMCYVDTEQILYTSISGGVMTVATNGRGYGGTTAATHANGAVMAQSKITANGYDIALNIDGANNYNYWITGLNTTATGVHTFLNFSPGQITTLQTALSNVGAVTQIQVPKTAAALTILKALNTAPNKEICIKSSGGTEIFLYTGVDLINYLITGVTRHVYDDASSSFPQIAHAVGDSIYWVEHPVWLMYGNSALTTAPDTDSTKQPLQDLTNSTNASWVFSTFYDNVNLSRPGAWAPMIISSLGAKSTTPSQYYTADASGGTDPNFANPATEMGIQFLAFLLSNIWKAETASIAWQFTHPFGITSVTTSGKKYCLSTTFPAQCGMFKSSDGKNFTSVWNETKPAANTWTNLAVNGVAKTLSGTYKTIRYWMNGSIAAVASNEADAQFDTITMAVDTTKRPIIVNGVEQANYTLNCTITNTTGASDPYNNWAISVYAQLALNQSIVVDCEARTIVLQDANGNQLGVIPSVQPSFTKTPPRSEWMCISPGTSQLTFTDTGTVAVTFATAWNDRSV